MIRDDGMRELMMMCIECTQWYPVWDWYGEAHALGHALEGREEPRWEDMRINSL